MHHIIYYATRDLCGRLCVRLTAKTLVKMSARLLSRDSVHPWGQLQGGRSRLAESGQRVSEANRGLQAHYSGWLLNGLRVFWMPSCPLEKLIYKFSVSRGQKLLLAERKLRDWICELLDACCCDFDRVTLLPKHLI